MTPIVWGIFIVTGLFMLPTLIGLLFSMEEKPAVPAWKSHRAFDGPREPVREARPQPRSLPRPQTAPPAHAPQRHQPWRRPARKPWRARNEANAD